MYVKLGRVEFAVEILEIWCYVPEKYTQAEITV